VEFISDRQVLALFSYFKCPKNNETHQIPKKSFCWCFLFSYPQSEVSV